MFIALMRNWFTERRELLTTLRDMLQEQAELKLSLLEAGIPWDELPSTRPLYKQAEPESPDQSPTSAGR